MTIENSSQSLELRPLVMKTIDVNSDEWQTETIVTNIESTSLDLHSVDVNKYNFTLQTLAKKGGLSSASASITESDANLLSLALLNPSEIVIGESPLSDLNQDFGNGITKTLRRYFVRHQAGWSASYDNSGNLNLDSLNLELLISNLPQDPNPIFQSVYLNEAITTTTPSGEIKLVSLSGNYLGIKITLLANADGTLEVATGDSFWVEFVTRNEGLVIAPKVTDLKTAVNGSEAINLDLLNAEVATLQAADATNLVTINNKVAQLSDSIANQNSFFNKVNSRWVGAKVLAFSSEQYVEGGVTKQIAGLADVSSISHESRIAGLALTNPVIDETGLTEEQIATSYNRRVYTSGVVRNVQEWNTAKGDVFAGPNGTLVELPPTSGRIIKLGQKLGTSDLQLAIQDYGFVYGIETVNKEVSFGPLTPTPRPDDLKLNNMFGLAFSFQNDEYKSVISSLNSDLSLSSTQNLSDFQPSTGNPRSYRTIGAKFPDNSGFAVVSYTTKYYWQTNPLVPQYILKFNDEGELVGSCLAPTSELQSTTSARSTTPVSIIPRSDGSMVYIAWVGDGTHSSILPRQWACYMWVIGSDMTIESGPTALNSLPPIDLFAAEYRTSWPSIGQVIDENDNIMFPAVWMPDIENLQQSPSPGYFMAEWLDGAKLVLVKISPDNTVTQTNLIDLPQYGIFGAYGSFQANRATAECTNVSLLMSDGTYVLGTPDSIVKVSPSGAVTNIPIPQELLAPYNQEYEWGTAYAYNLGTFDLFERGDGSIAFRMIARLHAPIYGDCSLVCVLNSDNTFQDAIALTRAWSFDWQDEENNTHTENRLDAILGTGGVLRNDGSYLVIGDASNNTFGEHVVAYAVVDLSTQLYTVHTIEDNSQFATNSGLLTRSSPNSSEDKSFFQKGFYYNKNSGDFIFSNFNNNYNDYYNPLVGRLFAIKSNNSAVEITSTDENRALFGKTFLTIGK